MNMRKTLEDTATGIASMAGPFADRMRDTADDLIDRIGTESRHLSEKAIDRVGDRLEHLPEAALDRLNLVTARRARRRTIMGLLVGLVLGAVLVQLFSGAEGERRRQAIRSKLGWGDPQSAAAVTGEVPK